VGEAGDDRREECEFETFHVMVGAFGQFPACDCYLLPMETNGNRMLFKEV
jgi:hypothetical protein